MYEKKREERERDRREREREREQRKRECSKIRYYMHKNKHIPFYELMQYVHVV